MLAHTSADGGGRLATAIGIATMLLGASGVFVQLQVSLNTIWKVMPKPGRSIWNIIRDRLLSFAVVAFTALTLLGSLIVNAVLAGMQNWLGEVLPAGSVALWQSANALVSFALITLLLAIVYKILPDVIVSWRDVWVGAVVTSVLFMLGKYLIALYLGRSGTSSAFGAAGSLVAILVWVYYSAQIVLFGAEFTRVYAECCGDRVLPNNHAMYTPAAQTRPRTGTEPASDCAQSS